MLSLGEGCIIHQFCYHEIGKKLKENRFQFNDSFALNITILVYI